MLPCELRWALAVNGTPEDDAVFLPVIDMCRPYFGGHERGDKMAVVACQELRRAILSRFVCVLLYVYVHVCV
jgi:hypothetical protein